MTTAEKDSEVYDSRLLHSLELANFLSFGEKPKKIELHALNLIIGPNGAGKSNLIEAIELLRNAPNDLQKPIREGGGIQDWIWKGNKKQSPEVSIKVEIDNPNSGDNWIHKIVFTVVNQRFELFSERISNAVKLTEDNLRDQIYYVFIKNTPKVWIKDEMRELDVSIFDMLDLRQQSILSLLRDPFQYPEITRIAQSISKVRIYREWQFGRNNPARLPQKADLPNDYLAEDASNLGLVLNRFKREPAVKKRVLEALSELYEGIDDYDVSIEGGTVQVFLQEGNTTIPATRLSDGTLRYLCLLAILCHPNPPPLVCIEEPELGLHPDIMPALAELLKEASTRSQLIVTTHSDELVDAMTDQPESVLVCERDEQGTTLTRLNGKTLKPWLEKYRLGDLWTRGEIGGTRW